MQCNPWSSRRISKPFLEQYVTLIALRNSAKDVWSQGGLICHDSLYRSGWLIQGGVRGFASVGRSVSREIVSERVEFPFDVLDTEVEILEGTQPAKLARREIVLAKEPLEHEMIAINVNWNTIQ